jgi:hypothetical protein
VAHWHIDLQEYNYKIMYISGKQNALPDALSRPPGVDQGKEDNQAITVLPPEKFKMPTIRHITPEGKVCIPPLNKVK